MDVTIEKIKESRYPLDDEETMNLLYLLCKLKEQDDDEITIRHAKGLYQRVIEISNPFTP